MADQNEIERERYAEYEAYRKNRERSESDFIEGMKDQLDISKQLNNSYKNVVEKLDSARDLQDKARVMQSRINSEIQKTKSQILTLDQVILRNNSDINDTKREMVANDNRLLQIDSARETLEKKRLLSEQELTISMYRREGLQWAISEKVREETEQLSRSADLTARITENNAEQQKIQERMSRGFLSRERGEAEISRLQQQNIIFAGELMISQNAMNQSGVEKLSLQQRLNSEMNVYENAYERSLGIENSMIELQKEKNQLQERNVNLKSKEQNLNERNERAEAKRNSLIEQRHRLQKSLVEWMSREAKAAEMITKLSAQLLFAKLIQMGYERFVALDKAAEEFRKQTGFSNTQMVELRKNAEAVNVELQEFGVGIEEAYDAAKSLTDVFGNTALVTKEAMTNVALMSANLGVAAKDSAEVLATFQGLGGASQETAMNVMKVGAGLSEKAGVPFKKVMEDIATASGETLAMLGANPSKLMKASIAARVLGTDMNKLVSAQSKLLDYSSSINSELEASALLGRSVSFQRARQLAYEGDIAGAAKSTLETVRKAGDFNKMNLYQRKALAAASGMELKDLTKMMAVEEQRKKIELSGTPEEQEQLRIQTETLKILEQENDLSKKGLLADGERAIRQQKMQGLMTKMKNLLESITVIAGDILEPLITPMVGILIPLLKVIAEAVKLILYPFKALAETIKWVAVGTSKWAMSFQPVKDAVETIGNGFSWLSEQVSKLFSETKEGGMSVMKALGALAGGALTLFFFGKGGFGKIMDMVKAPFKMVKDVGKNMLSKLTGKGAASDLIGPKLPDASAAGDGVGEAAKATKDVKSGSGIKDFLTNLADGLKKMGGVGVAKGAVNLLIASPGLITIIPGAVLAGLIPKKSGDNIESFLTGLASGLKAMGTGRVTGGAANLVLASVGLVTIIPGAIAAAVLGVVGKPIETGLKYLSKGIAYMGDTNVFKGALGIAAVGLSIIPFAFAMQMFSDVDWGAVGIGSLALIGFTAAAFGLGAILSSGVGAAIFGAGVAGIAYLGLALIPFAAAALIAGVGVKMLGEGIASSVDPILRLSEIDLTKAALGIGAIGIALTAFGAGSASAGLGSFVGGLLGGDPIAKMEKLASIGDKLKITAESITSIAQATSQFKAMDAFSESVTKLATSLGKLNDQISETNILKFAALTAMTSTAAATQTSETQTQTQTSSGNMAGVEAKLDKLTDLLAGGAIRVYLDGKDVSSGVANSFGG